MVPGTGNGMTRDMAFNAIRALKGEFDEGSEESMLWGSDVFKCEEGFGLTVRLCMDGG